MHEIRCTKCNKLLAKAEFQKIEIKCARCKIINSYQKVIEPHSKPPQSVNNEVSHERQNAT